MKIKNNPLYRIFSSILILIFGITVLCQSKPGYAQGIDSLLNLPQPGTMVPLSEIYVPPMIKGIVIDPANPLHFNFIIDTGHAQLPGEYLDQEISKLVKYFLASLTIPEEDMWVNLSPYEKDRVIPQNFGLIEMGRDLLAQDYILKQLSASLIYPEEEMGKKFWDRVYKNARSLYGTTDIPVNTFNKIWVIPDQAVVYEKGNRAFVLKTHLKVMLEEDYLALRINSGNDKLGTELIKEGDVKDTSKVSSAVVRDILIPEIEKEINASMNFANLRQIYYSLILASWYKLALKESLLGQVYVNKSKVKGVDVADKEVNEKIYQYYLEAFKKGVFNYIKKDIDADTKQLIPRKYFSGGNSFKKVPQLIQRDIIDGDKVLSPKDVAMLADGLKPEGPIVNAEVDLREKPGKAPSFTRPTTIDPDKKAPVGIVGKHTNRRTFLKWFGVNLGVFAIEMKTPPIAKAYQLSGALKNIKQIVLGIEGLRDPDTGISPSHYGHPGYEQLKFTYDAAVDAIILAANGKQKEAEKILDYFADRLRIPVADLKRKRDAGNIYGIVKLMEYKGVYNLKGLINAINYTSTKPQGRGWMEFYTTPGPMAIMGKAFLFVNRDKYQDVAVMMGNALRSMQRNDGGITDGDREPPTVNTEPHMDAYSYFLDLEKVTGDPQWGVYALSAYNYFRNHLCDSEAGVIFKGADANGVIMTHATDAYSWTMMGQAGDEMSLEELERYTNTMLSKSLTKVTLELPDGKEKTLILVDFTDPRSKEAIDLRGGFHPMGSEEWVGGVIGALQKNAVRFWQRGDQNKARFYAALANELVGNSLNGFYEIPGLQGMLTFYATGQNIETGHKWKTPYFYVKEKDRTIRGGTPVGAWPVLPLAGVNLFILDDKYMEVFDKIRPDKIYIEAAKEFIAKTVIKRSFREKVPTEVEESATYIHEPWYFNDKAWKRFLRGDYKGSIKWAKKVLNNETWIRQARGQQKQKENEIKGLVLYEWGDSPESRQAEVTAIGRYPLLNDVGAAMWIMAASHFELSKLKKGHKKNLKEAKKWMRRIIKEVSLHQIFAEDGPGYWNALKSWETNQDVLRDRQMGILYREILGEINLRAVALPEVDIGGSFAGKPATSQGDVELSSLKKKYAGSEDIWSKGIQGKYASRKWKAKAVYTSFKSPLRLIKGQRIKINYTLREGDVFRIQLLKVGEPESILGDMNIIMQGVGGANKTVTIKVPETSKVWRIAIQHGEKDAGGHLGGSYNSTLEIHSVTISKDAAMLGENLQAKTGSIDISPDSSEKNAVAFSSFPGGIDLSPDTLNLQIKRDGNGVPLPLLDQPVRDMNIEGFYPIIINVTPVPSLPLLMGMVNEQGVSQLTALR